MTENKVTWDLTDHLLGKTTEELEKTVKENVNEFKKIREELSNDITSARIEEILKLKEDIVISLEALEAYYGLQFMENTKDQQALAKMSYYDQLGTDIGNDIMFFTLWLMHLDDAIADKHINADELKEYKYLIERIRTAKKYTKTEEIEQIISLKSITGRGAFNNLYDIFTNNFTFDFKGKKGLTQEEIRKYVYDQDPQTRKEAYETYIKPFSENSMLIAEIYKNIILDWYNEGIKIRKYEKPIAIRDISNDIDDDAVQALLNTVKKNTAIFTDYFKLKQAINEKEGKKYDNERYHVYAPYAGKVEKIYDYEASKELVLDTFKAFDERFYVAAKEIFDANHVHSHPQPNKKSGAFCHYLGGVVKPYIFLNHTGTVRDLFTLAHEFGHGIHGVFAEKQAPLLHHAALPMAETASIFAEMILADRLLKESSDGHEKTAILTQLLDNQYASITRQAFFVLFEEQAHDMIQKGATTEELNKAYRENLQSQFGDMTIPEVFDHEWNYVPHIHATPFYCYAYAWGNLLVLALYNLYRKEGKPFIDKIVKLLEAGGSKRPQDLLKDLGITPDESFWQAGFDIIKEEVEQLKNLQK